MVNATVPLRNEKPATYGWLQLEKRAAGELAKLAMKSPAAMGTLLYLVNRMSRSNAIVISQAVLAEGVGVTRETANKAIRYLVEHNFLQVIKAGGGTVYVINSRVVWQGVRGERFAQFGADIVAVEDEQPTSLDDLPALKPVPQLQEGERLLVGNEPIEPPDQGELNLP